MLGQHGELDELGVGRLAAPPPASPGYSSKSVGRLAEESRWKEKAGAGLRCPSKQGKLGWEGMVAGGSLDGVWGRVAWVGGG